MTEPVVVDRRGAVLEVTLDRPKSNAIDAATSRKLAEVFLSFRDDPDLRVAVVTGAGTGSSVQAGTSRQPPAARQPTQITVRAASPG